MGHSDVEKGASKRGVVGMFTGGDGIWVSQRGIVGRGGGRGSVRCGEAGCNYW